MRITLSTETNVFLARATQAHTAYAARHKGTTKEVDNGSRIEEHGDGLFFALAGTFGHNISCPTPC